MIIIRRQITQFSFAFWLLLAAINTPAADSRQTADLDSFLTRYGYARVAFKRNERHQPLVDATLAGRQRVFLADTGCTMTTLQPGAAAGLKRLRDLGATLDDSFLGRLNDPSIAIMDKLVLGSAQFLNQPAVVEKLDMDFIRLQFDGILGLDFFFRNFCLIDCYRHKLYVRRLAFSEDESRDFAEVLRRSGFTEVPLGVGALISVDAKVMNEPVTLMVDTGASISTLDQSVATRLHLASIKSDYPAEGSLIRPDLTADLIGFNRIGSHKVRVTRLSSFELGSRQWKNISYGVADLQAWGLNKEGKSGMKLEGLFGADLLERHGVLIDFAARKLWLRAGGAK